MRLYTTTGHIGVLHIRVMHSTMLTDQAKYQVADFALEQLRLRPDLFSPRLVLSYQATTDVPVLPHTTIVELAIWVPINRTPGQEAGLLTLQRAYIDSNYNNDDAFINQLIGSMHSGQYEESRL